jgi:hypothetical protein
MKIVLIITSLVVVPCSATGVQPVLSAGGGGDNPLPPDPAREVCFSQRPNLDGLIGSSEVIGALGIQSELVNDFLVSGICVDNARWWGGYYTYVPGDPLLTSFNLRFYDDGGCVPNDVIAEYILCDNASETFIYDQSGYPIYEYNYGVGCTVVPDNLYWFGVQGGDHPFPPQWGRLEADGGVVFCDTVFKSTYFSYPDWTPAVEVFGVTFDASQELFCSPCIGPLLAACCIGDQGECRMLTPDECECQGGHFQGFGASCEPANPCLPVATVPSSWGTIKGLFR